MALHIESTYLLYVYDCMYIMYIPASFFKAHVFLAVIFCVSFAVTESSIWEVWGQLEIIQLECLIFWNNLFLDDFIASSLGVYHPPVSERLQ